MQNYPNLELQGTGVLVGFIDTGIDYTHPEFAGKISEYSYNATYIHYPIKKSNHFLHLLKNLLLNS